MKKNTAGSSVGQPDKKQVDPKKSKSTTKNTAGSVGQLGQAKTKSLGIDKKAKTFKDDKRYSYFKCVECHFSGFISMNEKSRISDDTMYNIHKKANPDHKVQYSNEDESL